jgi:hypothetical protein
LPPSHCQSPPKHTVSRARICKRLRGPGIVSEKSIPQAYVVRRAGTNRVVVPDRQAVNRFLGSLKRFKNTGSDLHVEANLANRFLVVCKTKLQITPQESFQQYCADTLQVSISTWGYIQIVASKAGQCRTNPWPAVPDWTLMPECRCRTEGVDYRKKYRCRTNFSPAFTCDFSISHSKNNTISICLWTCRVYHFPLPAAWTCSRFPFHNHQNKQYESAWCTPFLMPECRTVRHPVSPVPQWTKCWCRNQSDTGIRGPSPVPECSGTGLRYRMLECRCRRRRPWCRCLAQLCLLGC